ncbi:hypothetical protein IU449_16215 [Nocardia higoensis]|uniref:Uncharacterized protein n=1 Tax=Nocardia higoensis TaxID=228599 RepID=A0ABS0DC64_9NOCA|nr:hypothetical protein [Nocardia higoensis]MBF6356067.1 hypothetical protein [Nocardia higoensis]
MSFITTTVTGHDGISAKYLPGFEHGGHTFSGAVHVSLTGADLTAHLRLSIEDARSLLAQLPGVLAEHDAAVASDKAA